MVPGEKKKKKYPFPFMFYRSLSLQTVLLALKIVRPYLFKGNLNSGKFPYTDILEVLDNMSNEIKHNLWIQCDGASIHNTRLVQDHPLKIFRVK